LTEKLNSVRKIPQWELVLLREEIASSGLLERAEQGLFLKINDYLSANSMVRASFRTYFAAVFGRLVNYRAIGIAIIAGLSLFGGYRAYRDNFQLIPIALYQVQGARQDLFNSPLPPKGLIQSEKGGGLTFVSKKGYVELQNGSQVEIKSASEKKVEYRAAFADVDNQLIGQGSATFFVNHQKKGQRYIVSTRDYRVEVTGTYFRLQPDIGEHVSVAVREGSLNIVFNNGEIKRLKAGQILAYDLNSNSYATSSDGMVIARQDIEQLPDIKDLNFYRQLSISTTPSAGIRIDGRFAGMSPLIIMQPKGVHSISIERSGYQTVDTSVTMGAGVAGAISLTLSPITDTTSLRQNVIVYEEVHVVNHVKPRQNLAAQAPVVSPAPQANAPKPEESPAYGDNDFRDAERLESGNWEKAIELYRAITENPLASRLQREAALFSIGKMKAEHEPVKTEAKEAFLNYLALYPTGNFVGESWLRLAELEFGNNQDKAIEYYQRYFEHFPGHSRVSELQHRVGLIYLQKKKYDEAIAMFKLSLANYQMDNIIDKGKIQSSLYRALKEKDDSQKTLPAAADVEQALKTR
jgi:tetratricopeptide (TPR) repeat protein